MTVILADNQPEPEPTPKERLVLALDAAALAFAELADALEESDL